MSACPWRTWGWPHASSRSWRPPSSADPRLHRDVARDTGFMSDNSEKLRLGGMALRNGLLVHGPTHWAAAVRTDDGEVKVASGRKPRIGAGPVERVPGVRGVAK